MTIFYSITVDENKECLKKLYLVWKKGEFFTLPVMTPELLMQINLKTMIRIFEKFTKTR